MPLQSLQQRYLDTALTHVEEVRAKDPKTQRVYGGLCHTFPIMVRTNGLCQALAFVLEKKGEATRHDSGREKPQAVAYACLWSHAAEVIGIGETGLLARLRTADTATYLRDTRRILDVWVYYKRFAVSVLNVQPGEEIADAATPEEAIAAAESPANAAPVPATTEAAP